jgi:hypothetical protein
MDALRRIRRLQIAIAACDRSGGDCEGVVTRDAEHGHIPRGLYLDRFGRHATATVVVGHAPGQPKSSRAEVYADDAPESDAKDAQDFFEREGRRIEYYERIRGAVRALRLPPATLWTDVVKCSAQPASTFGVVEYGETHVECARRFLLKELACVPADWYVLAAGQQVYTLLLLALPRRPVIGIPHPSPNARAAFDGVFHGPPWRIVGDATHAWRAARGEGRSVFLRN